MNFVSWRNSPANVFQKLFLKTSKVFKRMVKKTKQNEGMGVTAGNAETWQPNMGVILPGD